MLAIKSVLNTTILGDSLKTLKEFPDECIDCIVTSPPYWKLRDYKVNGQMGLEDHPDEYIRKMVKVFSECRRVLKKTGVLWLNMGDGYAQSGRRKDTREIKQNRERAKRQGYHTAAFSGYEGWDRTANTLIAGLKRKDLIGMPWMLAFALRYDGWYLRSDIIWHKPNPMPESVKDRCTKAHEYIFMLTKSKKYFYDWKSIKSNPADRDFPGQPSRGVETLVRKHTPPTNWDTDKGSHGSFHKNGRRSDKQRGHSRRHDGFNDRWDLMTKAEQQSNFRNKRSVWEVATYPMPEAHFATFPPKLIEPCILAGCPQGGIVLDPFMGSGTTGRVAIDLKRNYVGIELNPDYIAIEKKLPKKQRLFV